MSDKENGIEIATIHPGWIKRNIPAEYLDESFKRIIMFFVINTPCIELSSSGIEIKKYGWEKDVWKNNALKNELFKKPNLERGESFIVAKKTNEMKSACEKARLKKGFQKYRDEERIVIYKNKSNEFLSLCSHIRNAFAHGRFAIYISEDKDNVYVLEDGVKRNGKFHVRSRMVIKKSTLLHWIDTIETGRLPDNDTIN